MFNFKILNPNSGDNKFLGYPENKKLKSRKFSKNLGFLICSFRFWAFEFSGFFKTDVKEPFLVHFLWILQAHLDSRFLRFFHFLVLQVFYCSNRAKIYIQRYFEHFSSLKKVKPFAIYRQMSCRYIEKSKFRYSTQIYN